MNGILIVDKPKDLTSADIVRIVKRRYRCKTGHLGTLDPFATGLLPICVGEGTKIAQFLNDADKEYVGTVQLGSQTDTGDPTGTVIRQADVPSISDEQLAAVARLFVGEQMQTPPMYSAVKQQGTPLYKLARQGVEVERQARPVKITEFELHAQGSGVIGIRVACSKGTYVRVLAEDIATRLGTVGHLQSLRRVRFGRFTESQALTLSEIEAGGVTPIDLRDALGHLDELVLDANAARQARHGFQPLLTSLGLRPRAAAVKLVSPEGELAAIIAADRASWRFLRVFQAAAATA
jgi:tRNA pseudouridine55 synthase